MTEHCAWCRAGKRAQVIAHLRGDPRADTKELAQRYRVGFWYVQQIRKVARNKGCLPERGCPCGTPTPNGGRCATCARRVHLHQWAAHNRWRLNRHHHGVMPWLLPPIGAAYVRPT